MSLVESPPREELSSSWREPGAAPAVERDDRPVSGGRALLEALGRIDLILLASACVLTLLGLWSLAGATQGTSLANVADKQLLWFGIALGALAMVLVIDYHWLGRLAPFAYVANLGLLAAVLVVGTEVNSAKSWFRIGPVGFQPAETMKIATVLVLAQWWAHRPEGAGRLRDLLVPAMIAGAPAALILKQPDLGSACLFAVIFGALLVWAGVRRWILALLVGVALLGAAGAWPVLKPYQKERIYTFIDPSRDPLNSGYQVIQSTVAIGSGGVLGRGWGEGTQAVHRYLPEAHTDFIFAATVEQLGLVGALGVIGLYGIMLWRMLVAVHLARDRFGAFVVVGLGAIIVGHVAINVGMNVGLFPITGLPLPFLSYGGSFLVTMFVVAGLVLNVSMRRFVFARSS